MNNYYNTTSEVGQILIDFESKAKSQDEYILKKFMQNPDKNISPEDVQIIGVPITSIRRAFTNLAKRGLIQKSLKVAGMYGRPIYKYKLIKNEL